MFIAIDGLGGAGKSSLARALCAELPGAVHVEFDWFHLPKSEVTGDTRFDSQRVQNDLIIPFRAGYREFVFKRYNWGYLSGSPDGLADEPIQLRGVEVLVLEGCGTLGPELSHLYDLRIWVDTPPAEALARGMRRDIEEYGLDPTRVKSAWEEWKQWESRALAHDDRRLRADITFTDAS
jgi:uridine kinase